MSALSRLSNRVRDSLLTQAARNERHDQIAQAQLIALSARAMMVWLTALTIVSPGAVLISVPLAYLAYEMSQIAANVQTVLKNSLTEIRVIYEYLFLGQMQTIYKGAPFIVWIIRR